MALCSEGQKKKVLAFILGWRMLRFLLPHRYPAGVYGLSSIVKSSFVHRQLGRSHDSALRRVASAEEILYLAHKNSGRTHGSKGYIKAWRHWERITVEAIRHDLSMNLPHPVEAIELEKLSFELGVAADKGQMPSFSSPGARSGYALDYFCRARLLAALFVNTANPSLPSFWTQSGLDQQYSEETNNAISYLTGSCQLGVSNGQCSTVQLTSLGGGPGFDFVAAAMAIAFSTGGNTDVPPVLKATILDYEEGWESLVEAMSGSTTEVLGRPTWRCEWGGKCDITKALDHTNNESCRAAIQTTHIWTCQYCVAENANELRASKYIFFRDLWHAVPVGSVFVITETTPRLWPEFHKIIQEHCPFMEVSFPNQKGPQLLLRKSSRTTGNCSSYVDDRLIQFEEMASRHEERLASGRERQAKKRYSHISTLEVPTFAFK